jgi:alanine racemase
MKYETVLEIDLKKLKNNTKLLAKSYSDYKYKIVDLKDNAHGLGLKIINTMERYGINFCLGNLMSFFQNLRILLT